MKNVISVIRVEKISVINDTSKYISGHTARPSHMFVRHSANHSTPTVIWDNMNGFTLEAQKKSTNVKNVINFLRRPGRWKGTRKQFMLVKRHMFVGYVVKGFIGHADSKNTKWFIMMMDNEILNAMIVVNAIDRLKSRHKMIHGIQRISCKFCNESFKVLNYLRQHEKMRHSAEIFCETV